MKWNALQDTIFHRCLKAVSTHINLYEKLNCLWGVYLPRVIIGITCNNRAPMEVSRQSELFRQDPSHERRGLGLAASEEVGLVSIHLVSVELVGEVSVEVLLVCVVPADVFRERLAPSFLEDNNDDDDLILSLCKVGCSCILIWLLYSVCGR